jgi:hypothetical protein
MGKIIRVDRLPHVVVSAVLKRFDRSVHRSESGHHDDDNIAVEAVNPAIEFDAVHAGHFDIQQDKIDAAGAENGDRLVGILSRLNIKALREKPFLEGIADRLLIVNN